MIARRVRREDDGATLIVAILVMLILSTLSIAVLGRTLSSMAFIRHGQDYDAALAAADAGLSDALYTIDQSAPPTWTTGKQLAAGKRYDYQAIKKSDTEYEIRSIGAVGRSKHGIRARVSRTARYPYALFSNQDLTFNGNSSLNIYSMLQVGGPPTGRAFVGSNGKIVVHSGKGAGDAQHFYAPGGGCVGCPNPVEHKQGPYALEPIVAPTTHAGCPGLYDALHDRHLVAGIVNPGTYVCTKHVAFTGTIAVAGNSPFVLHLVRGSSPSAAAPKLDISGAIINPLGKSRNFQILKAGDGELNVGVGNTSTTLTYNGIMYAPESTVTVNGGKYWVGSWAVNKLVVNGGPNIQVGYDLDLETYFGIDWKVSRYAEVPSASIPLT